MAITWTPALGDAAAIAEAPGSIARATLPALPAEFFELRWYALQTRANHERRVAEHLAARDIENCLPLYEAVRQWKDRRVALHLPLFPGYVFVRTALRDRLRALQLPGAAKFVSFNGMPAPLQQQEIEAVRASLCAGAQAAPHPYVAAGQRARILKGPLAGLQGIVLRTKGTYRLVLNIELIQRAVAVELDAADLTPTLG